MCAQKTSKETKHPDSPRAPLAAETRKTIDPAEEDTQKARKLVEAHTRAFRPLERKANLAWFEASVRISDKTSAERAKLDLALRRLHSDPKTFAELGRLRKAGRIKDQLLRRQVELLHWAFLENQIPPKTMKALVDKSTEIDKIFSSFRGKIGRKKVSTNDILAVLAKERSSARRKEAWEAGKQVGPSVAPHLLALVKLRNQAARSLGFANYYEMKLRAEEHDPAKIKAIFEELDRLTRDPYKRAKADLDKRLARRFRTKPERLMPWHYEDLFFQDIPKSVTLDMDRYYLKKDPQELAGRFYKGLGFDVTDILKRSDLFERLGKDQHAFCIDMDRQGDVRVMANIKPNERWTSTLLHELGHGVYFKYNDPDLPYLLRQPAHTLTTEGIAMMFEHLVQNPSWLEQMGIVPKAALQRVSKDLSRVFRLQILIFARWSLVMVNFERMLYENPDQDLDRLWWDLVEKHQMLNRVPGRKASDWATKIHICSVPVYYHNYMLGQMFAAQLTEHLAKEVLKVSSIGDVTFINQTAAGAFLLNRIFKAGGRDRWDVFVKKATGQALSSKALASMLQKP